jgi:glutamate carboxypeptidase
MKRSPSEEFMTDLRLLCAQHLPDTLNLTKQIAALESPSTDKSAVDACAAFVAEQLRSIGAQVQSVPQTSAGNHLLATWGGRAQSDRQFLSLLHLDTVWPIGTLSDMPIREDAGKLYGPGIYDMKAGAAMTLVALRILQESGLKPRHEIHMLFTSDEEIGSETSRALIEAEAQKSALVLVMEPAMAGGQLKTFRKGVGTFNITAYGRAAHAGVDHQKGVNAIEELAHQIVQLQKMTDYIRGTTVNVGTIRGGSASNVVPERAEMEVDFRVSKMSEGQRIESMIKGLKPALNGTRLEISGGLNRPPMERTPKMVETFEQAKRLGASLGLKLEEGSTGGGSDGNFTAALGVPTLDGLGAIGDGAHAAHEHVIIDSLIDRTALLATIWTQWE